MQIKSSVGQNSDLPNTKISIEQFKQSLQKNNSKKEVLSHSEMLEKLLEGIKKIKFRDEVDDLEENKKLQKKHYLIISIEKLSEIAENNKWSLCQRDGVVYLYNGEFWKQISNSELRHFLGLVAEKMGVSKFDAQHYSFKEELLKQFYSSQYLPEAKRTNEKVLINLKNGTFEVTPKGGKLRPFSKDDFLTYQLPFEYTPTSKAPLFEKYLNRVQPDDSVKNVLAEYLAYIFTKHLKLEKALLLYGSGANGKSVFFDIVTALVGQENTTNYSLQSLTDEKGYSRAKIPDALVNYASEINGKLESNTFKLLVSGEPVDARSPHKEPFIIRDYARLIFNCNELPRDVEHTNAFFRRFLIVPFNAVIPKAEQDKELSKKIIESELSGVFNWVLDGLERILKYKQFSECEPANDVLKQFEKESDTTQLFLEENNFQKSDEKTISMKELYREYRQFCNDSGYQPLNKNNFKKRLERLSYEVSRKNTGNHCSIEKKH